MFDQESKSLMIVYDKESTEFASYLIQLIGQKDDQADGIVIGPKDGSIKAAMWDAKEYRNSMSNITSDTHVLFLGDSKLINENKNRVQVDFSKYGMNFGWLGKRAVMYVDSRSYAKDEYIQFVKFAKKELETFKENVEEVSLRKKIAVTVPLFLVGGAAAVGISALVHHFKLKNIYFKERFYTLALHTYLHGLSKFMES